MAGEEYTSAPSTGKLKLKGVSEGRIDKKKKKKKVTSEAEILNTDSSGKTVAGDRSVVLKTLEDEDDQITKENRRRMGIVGGVEVGPGAGVTDDSARESLKTDAERRFEEQRKKRLEERLRKEGVKTHKQRVEELNKYLSGLSEHHDMPKIGPG